MIYIIKDGSKVWILADVTPPYVCIHFLKERTSKNGADATAG